MKSNVGGERVEEGTKGKTISEMEPQVFSNLHKTAICNAQSLKDIFVL